MDDVGREDAEQDDGRGAPDEGDASVLEGGEESGSDLQADREDEEDEPELLDEVADLAVDGHPEVAGDDPDEEDPGDSERDALDLDLSEEDAEGDDQREGQDGMSDAVSEEEGIQPVHIFASFRPKCSRICAKVVFLQKFKKLLRRDFSLRG